MRALFLRKSIFVVIALGVGMGLTIDSPLIPITYAAGQSNSSLKHKPRTLIEAIAGNGDAVSAESADSAESERLDPDRPHLPEASTTVGKGRVLLEGGFTLNERDVSSFSSQGYPEGLLRIGALAEWFEFRIGQSFLRQQSTLSGVTSKVSGAQDLYLGVKFALPELSAGDRSDTADDGPDGQPPGDSRKNAAWS
jgi:hypothetical protein